MIYYFDLDGVLANFNERVESLLGVPRSEIPKKELWKAVNSDENFFQLLKPMPLVNTAREMIEGGHNVNVLTATGNKYDLVAPQKMLWAKTHLGLHPNKVHIVKSGSDKRNWASKDSVLIDDTRNVIELWNLNGGIGLHYTTDSHDKIVKDILSLIDS